ncbi:MAG: PatA/PatG family cyanobactin maturation protease [Verrucomicrobiae bacterium]|nr:PatA/PatG family cyanobactin maturation protease [Verrucomicrobiae bacterium]
MNALEPLWRISIGDARIVVAVLDGPIDRRHPGFEGADLTVLNALTTLGSDVGAADHGTHIASLIFGQPGSPVPGVAPRCRGLIIPIYRATPEGGATCSQLDLARAVDLATEHGAHVINISGGEPGSRRTADPLLANAIRRAIDRGVLVVAAAGNDGDPEDQVPAALPGVLAVGAADEHGEPVDSNNWGATYRVQGVLAPGTRVRGALPGGGTDERSGSSYAAPRVAGVAALLLSIQLQRGLAPNSATIRTVLLETADRCDPRTARDCRRWFAGRLNPAAALARILADTGTRRAPAFEPPTRYLRFHGVQPLESRSNQARTNRKVPVMSEANESTHGDTVATPIVNTEPPGPRTLPGSPSAPAHAMREAEPAAGIQPAGCACSCACGGAPALVYVLGQIGYDFGSEARRDSLLQQTGKNVQDPGQWLAAVEAEPALASSVIWTLNVDATPIYAVKPAGPFATEGYLRLREFLKAQLAEGIERVSIPGVLPGGARLLSGPVVPAIVPEVRGMYNWSTGALVDSVLGPAPKKKDEAEHHAEQTSGISRFLERVYYEVRNLGVTSADRAMNYAATNAFQVQTVFRSAIEGGFKLDCIEVERSVICRPGSDCWDVKLTFFHPSRRLEQARRVHRFTIDVSDIVPVTVGRPRHWEVY